jgi:methyl-accepting chemotaxis protein
MERERFALTQVRRRLHRIAAVTKRFAAGQFDQRLEAVAADEIGQIEDHLNQVAEQFVELLAREKLLVEQNARLEERAHLSQDLHDSVKQHDLCFPVAELYQNTSLLEEAKE